MKVRVLGCQPRSRRDHQNCTHRRSDAERLDIGSHSFPPATAHPARLQAPDAASVALNRSKSAANPRGRISSTKRSSWSDRDPLCQFSGHDGYATAVFRRSLSTSLFECRLSGSTPVEIPSPSICGQCVSRRTFYPSFPKAIPHPVRVGERIRFTERMNPHILAELHRAAHTGDRRRNPLLW